MVVVYPMDRGFRALLSWPAGRPRGDTVAEGLFDAMTRSEAYEGEMLTFKCFTQMNKYALELTKGLWLYRHDFRWFLLAPPA